MRKITDCELLAIDQLVKCVKDESNRQLKKWGIQTVTPFEWMTYLTEEIGELAQAISEFEYGRGPKKNVFEEAIQAATLILKIAEMYSPDLKHSKQRHENTPYELIKIEKIRNDIMLGLCELKMQVDHHKVLYPDFCSSDILKSLSSTFKAIKSSLDDIDITSLGNQ